MVDRKTLKGTLHISRYDGHDGPGVTIELKDKLSGTVAVKLEMSFEDFGIAATSGLGDCEFRLPSKVVGKAREVKHEWVPAPGGKKDSEALAQFEVDGWKARRDDYGNHHRSRKKDDVMGYNVTFIRFVDPQ